MRQSRLSMKGGAVVLTSCLASHSIMAAEGVTQIVKGREPVVDSVGVINQNKPGIGLRVGDAAKAAYNFSDADGDAESGTSFQWLRNGIPINGANKITYTTVTEDANSNLSISINPRTSVAFTDPANGLAVTSAEQMVVAAGAAVSIGSFTPHTSLMNWDSANGYCQTQGARLPTVSELQGLFVDATSATGAGQQNSEMCIVYGWPLSVECGGGTSYYWSSEQANATSHSTVHMGHGGANNYSNSASLHVACIR